MRPPSPVRASQRTSGVSFPRWVKGVSQILHPQSHCWLGGGGGLAAMSCPTLAIPWTVACQAPLPIGIHQARILEWVAMPSSSQPGDQTQASGIASRFFTIWATREPSWKVKVKSLSRVRLCHSMDCSLPGSMGFSRQEYWSGLPFPSPGDLPDPEIEPRSPAFQADPLTSELPGEGRSC